VKWSGYFCLLVNPNFMPEAHAGGIWYKVNWTTSCPHWTVRKWWWISFYLSWFFGVQAIDFIKAFTWQSVRPWGKELQRSLENKTWWTQHQWYVPWRACCVFHSSCVCFVCGAYCCALWHWKSIFLLMSDVHRSNLQIGRTIQKKLDKTTPDSEESNLNVGLCVG